MFSNISLFIRAMCAHCSAFWGGGWGWVACQTPLGISLNPIISFLSKTVTLLIV